MNKTFKYKGFVCYWNKEEERYELYSKESEYKIIQDLST